MFGAAAIGPRDEQQDAYQTGDRWIVVADGMGGHSAGQLAAEVAVEALAGELDADDDVESAIAWACRQVVEEGGGGTTAVLAQINGGEATIFWVGDSRAYRVSGGDAELLTDDHVGPDGGLTRWIPDEPACERVDCILADGDALVLCTDGVSDVLDGEQIAAAAADPDDPAAAIVEAALEAGASDNCTAVVYVA